MLMRLACFVWWIQDDEYLASLAADREKEMKAIEEAEARRVQEEVARKAALEEERRKEEESRRKLEEEQVLSSHFPMLKMVMELVTNLSLFSNSQCQLCCLVIYMFLVWVNDNNGIEILMLLKVASHLVCYFFFMVFGFTFGSCRYCCKCLSKSSISSLLV